MELLGSSVVVVGSANVALVLVLAVVKMKLRVSRLEAGVVLAALASRIPFLVGRKGLVFTPAWGLPRSAFPFVFHRKRYEATVPYLLPDDPRPSRSKKLAQDAMYEHTRR